MSPESSDLTAAGMVPGVLSGLAGLLTFLALHHVWIVPIWFVLPLGAATAVLGGIVVQRSYDTLRNGLPDRPWTAPALVVVVAVVLLPSFVLAEVRAPLFDVSGPDSELAVAPVTAAAVFVLELLVVTTVTGAVVGWMVGRTTASARTTALAGFVFALGPGHNIPFIGGTPGVATEVALITAATVAAAITLVEVDTRSRSADRARAAGPRHLSDRDRPAEPPVVRRTVRRAGAAPSPSSGRWAWPRRSSCTVGDADNWPGPGRASRVGRSRPSTARSPSDSAESVVSRSP